MFAKLYVTLALTASAFATVFITEPTGTTTWQAGQQVTISWKEDGTAPLLAAFGNAIVSIYTGNAQQQTSLQTIAPSVNVATTGSIIFTPDPTIGPNADEYFVRFQSLTATDPTSPTIPALAFSAKFTMSGMTGTFNSTVQAQIAGQSTAPIVSPSATGVNGAQAASSSVVATSTGSTVTKVVSASSTASTASSTSSSSQASSARGITTSIFSALAGIVAVLITNYAL